MEHIPQVFWLIPIASVCALGMAWYFFKSMMRSEEGTPRMIEIAEYVRRGAMASMHRTNGYRSHSLLVGSSLVLQASSG